MSRIKSIRVFIKKGKKKYFSMWANRIHHKRENRANPFLPQENDGTHILSNIIRALLKEDRCRNPSEDAVAIIRVNSVLRRSAKKKKWKDIHPSGEYQKKKKK
jgi:hypothetical protein